MKIVRKKTKKNNINNNNHNYKMKIYNSINQNLNYALYQIFLSFRWLILSTKRENNKILIKSRRMSKSNRIMKTEILM